MENRNTFIAMVDKAIAMCSSLAAVASCLLVFSIALLGAVDVLTSFLFNAPIPAATNYAEEVLPATVLLASGMVIRRRNEIVVDLITQSAAVWLRKLLNVLASAGSFCLFALLTFGGWTLAFHSISIQEHAVAAVEFPVWPMKLAYAIGATIAMLEAMLLLVSPSEQINTTPDSVEDAA